MDRHGSYMDDAFILKATEYNIRPFPFPGHLTHILQPLDVSVFQLYKHWHRKAVQHATQSLDIDYTISSFIRDLRDIRISQGQYKEPSGKLGSGQLIVRLQLIK
jgi:hypothetical protein